MLALLAGGPSSGQSLRITDSLRREVAIPSRVERVISLEPEVTRIIVALGGGERLVALDYFLRDGDHLFPLIYPKGRNLPVVSNRAQDLNFEAAARLRPDVIFSSPSEFQMTESIEKKMRVPVAALASGGRFRDLLGEIELIGRILGREKRAAELVDFFNRKIKDIRSVLSLVSQEGRPRVFISFWGSLVRTPISYEPVEEAGGTNCAAGLLPSYLGAPGTTISIEQIVLWNPDIILVQGNYPPAERQVTVEGVLGDARLSSLRAVRERRVYYTFGFWYWWDPALVLVESLYLSGLFHPALFPGFDLEKEGNMIFQEFYGKAGLFSELSKILKCHEWARD